jgi:DNA sulfur modification protein DndC
MTETTYTDKVANAKADILRMYLDETDSKPWGLAYSGGKDSTVTAALTISVIESLPVEQRTRKVYLGMSNTVMENPNMDTYMLDQIDKINRYAAKNGLPIEAKVLTREPEQSYFYLTLGKGYFLPLNNGQGKWCTQRLKIEPQDRFFKSIDPSYILMGVRRSESSSREKSIDKWSISEKIGDHVSLACNTFMPIVRFTVEDVWRYLTIEGVPWGSTMQVRTLYREATGECGFTNPKGVEKALRQAESCGARFGCWTCPVVMNDRSTEKMAESHEWMEPLTEWRETQLKIYGQYKPIKPDGQSREDRSKALRKWEAINEQIRLITKAGHNRKGKRMPDGQGTLTVEARKWLFERLIETQSLVNRLRGLSGLKPLELISAEEITLIMAMWAEDEKNTPHLITNKVGKSTDALFDLTEGIVADEVLTEYLESKRKKKTKGASE